MRIKDGIISLDGVITKEGLQVLEGISIFGVGGGVIPSPYCTWMTYILNSDSWTTPAAFNSVAQTMTLENTSGIAIASYNSVQTWQTNDGLVSFENDVQQIDNASSFDQTIAAVDLAQGEIIGGVYITSLNGGEIRNAYNGTPIGIVVMDSDYVCGFKIDPDAETVTIYDSEENLATESLNPLFNPANDLNLNLTFLTVGANKFVNKLNTGSSAFTLAFSEGTYCDPVTPPPSVLCSPVNLTILQRASPNDQIMILSGANNLTCETTSLANSGVQSAVFATETFQTTTEEVKIECTLVKDTTTLSGVGSQMPIFFMQDLFTSPLLSCGAVYFPWVDFGGGAGALIDANSGTPLVENLGSIIGYTVAIYLDATGSARYKDSEGNSGALALSGSYDNAKDNYMVSPLNAGRNFGEELDCTMNFGSSNFILGEDAERHCNV